MKWISLSKVNSPIQIFNLVENNAVQAVLRYCARQHSARLHSPGTQRVFFVDQAGFRDNHFIFKNEYGFEAARVRAENTQAQNGVIEIDGENIQYALPKYPHLEMVIYAPDGVRPIAICDLSDVASEKSTALFDGREFKCAEACLLWGFYWYTSNRAVNELISVQENRFSLAW